MRRVHFLNVNDGDCSIIQHNSARNTVIDVSAAKVPEKAVTANKSLSVLAALLESSRSISKAAGVSGNFNQSEYPDDPIQYMRDYGINSVFRFISTHPDMDHLDGFKAFWDEFNPANFWDTENTKEMEDFDEGRYNPDDWEFYKKLRDGNPEENPKRLVLYSSNTGDFWNSDGLHILAPTPALVTAANGAEDWNDSSYVILYRCSDKRILFSSDSHDLTWEHILKYHRAAVSNVDVLIAPHHGRDSDRDHTFLDVVKPRLTLFGNAPSEHMAYDDWNNRGLLFITNNQAGTIIIDVVEKETEGEGFLDVYVKNETFARAFVEERDYDTYYSAEVQGWFIGRLK